MRIKEESAGKIFATHKQSVVKYDLNVTQLDDTTYEVEIKHRIRVVTVRLPYALYEFADQYARKNKTTISDVIRKALSEYLRGGKE